MSLGVATTYIVVQIIVPIMPDVPLDVGNVDECYKVILLAYPHHGALVSPCLAVGIIRVNARVEKGFEPCHYAELFWVDDNVVGDAGIFLIPRLEKRCERLYRWRRAGIHRGESALGKSGAAPRRGCLPVVVVDTAAANRVAGRLSTCRCCPGAAHRLDV